MSWDCSSFHPSSHPLEINNLCAHHELNRAHGANARGLRCKQRNDEKAVVGCQMLDVSLTALHF